ncbi:Fine tangled pili major subunit [Rubripirellula lacrimiformis]|uniref:Fine tangled pili major subunit n=1 Tax=Rubripirellula lacrimiformis TaxID=1930273 RepID=A0A517NFN5_9BACT|nr:DNA starvation/stationary phase protection protein [Rubripirellula lacrimiformis]QDT05949.1 Fine tangled pili major subunit [Rubripirellula lacrimiformis]
MSSFKRSILSEDKQGPVAEALQKSLYNLIDLALVGKQAHWNVLGRNFLSVHEQLDLIIESARMGSDEVAERIVTIGIAPDGRVKTIAGHSELAEYASGFQTVDSTITSVSDALATTIAGLRSGIEVVGDLDPISEDLLIGISSSLEKHLWMLQAQE